MSERHFRLSVVFLLAAILASQLAVGVSRTSAAPTLADLQAIRRDSAATAEQRSKRIRDLYARVPLVRIEGDVSVDVNSPLTVEFDGAQPVYLDR